MTQLGSLIEPIGGPGAAPPEDAHEPVRAPVSRPPNYLMGCRWVQAASAPQQ